MTLKTFSSMFVCIDTWLIRDLVLEKLLLQIAQAKKLVDILRSTDAKIDDSKKRKMHAQLHISWSFYFIFRLICSWGFHKYGWLYVTCYEHQAKYPANWQSTFYFPLKTFSYIYLSRFHKYISQFWITHMDSSKQK